MKKFSIPSGTRDLILSECTNRSALRKQIEQVFDRFGYDEIITPSIEYYQTYQTGFEQLKDEAMYKFFDHEGKILTLRMDMTVPIARAYVSKFKERKGPFRFRYCANVYKVKQSFAGNRNEVSDCGIELIGLHAAQADLEILICALEVMQVMQQQDYTLEIGDVNFFHSACQYLQLQPVQIETLADLIDRKTMIELQEYLKSLCLSSKHQTFFMQLPLMCGNQDMLQEAKQYCICDQQIDIIERMISLMNDIKELGYQDHITFDLGKVPHLNYYSGLLFEGFVKGIGTSVLSGGRYDQLLEKFNHAQPAIGFSVKLEYLLDHYQAQKAALPTIILQYPMHLQIEAMKEAARLRKTHRVKLQPCDTDKIICKEETL